MIPISKPCLGEKEVDAAAAVLRSGWLSQGFRVAAFERAFADYVGARHACAVSNCTTALHLALVSLGIGRGDEVITVSHSFIATANCIAYCGATPVFVDIDPGTCNIDPALIEAAITGRTKALLCVHQVGMPCDLPAILEICARHGIPLVEDAACAIGSEIRIDGEWQKIGRPHGIIACFSLHPRKVITTGEGGMLTTDSEVLARQFAALRQHCMSVSDTRRHSAHDVVFEAYPDVGFNYRMTDIQAAIGCEQLRRLPAIVEERRELAKRYQKLLAGIPGLQVVREPNWARSNWQSYPVRLSDRFAQKPLMQNMLDGGVATRRGIMCSHRESAYPRSGWLCPARLRSDKAADASCSCEPGHCSSLLHSEVASDSIVLLPLYPDMSYDEQDFVVSALADALQSLGSPGDAAERGHG